MEAKKRFIDSIRAARHEAGELPTQENPGIDQKQADTQQKETQSRIARGGGSPHTAQDTIAAFDSESAAIFLVDGLDSPIKTDDDKSQPLAPSFSGLIGD